MEEAWLWSQFAGDAEAGKRGEHEDIIGGLFTMTRDRKQLVIDTTVTEARNGTKVSIVDITPPMQ